MVHVSGAGGLLNEQAWKGIGVGLISQLFAPIYYISMWARIMPDAGAIAFSAGTGVQGGEKYMSMMDRWMAVKSGVQAKDYPAPRD